MLKGSTSGTMKIYMEKSERMANNTVKVEKFIAHVLILTISYAPIKNKIKIILFWSSYLTFLSNKYTCDFSLFFRKYLCRLRNHFKNVGI